MVALAALVFGQASLAYYDFPGFRIKLPAPPEAVDTPKAPKGTQSWGVRTGDGGSIMITVVDVDKPQPPDQMLAQFAEGVRGGIKGVLTGQRDLSLEGWPGLAADLSTPRGTVWGRSFAFPKSLVYLAFGGGKLTVKDVDAVVASIKIDPKVGVGPAKQAGPTWGRVPLESPYSVDFPVKPEPRSPAPGSQMRGWASKYGNRAYAAYVTLLDPATPSIPTEQLGETARLTNEGAVRAAKATLAEHRASTIFGFPADTVEALSPDGETSLTFQTMVTPRGSLMLAAVVPKCLRRSPEVSHFFSSLCGDR